MKYYFMFLAAMSAVGAMLVIAAILGFHVLHLVAGVPVEGVEQVLLVHVQEDKRS